MLPYDLLHNAGELLHADVPVDDAADVVAVDNV